MTRYYSAIGTENRGRVWPVRRFFKGRHGIAFQADINDGIPHLLYTADVWYADLPWQHGYRVFAARAGRAQKRTYQEFLLRLGAEVRASNKPAVLVSGRHAGKYLGAIAQAPVRLNDTNAVAYLYGIEPWGDTRDCWDVLRELAKRFSCVGDFCCGYGRAGMVFAQAGKRYVMSDINPRCIGYIAIHEKTWR